MRAGIWGMVVAGAAVLLGACGGGSTGDVSAPASTSGAGARIYANKCAECHGANMEGTAKGPSHLSKVYEPSHHSDASFRQAIAKGSPQHHWNFGAMPPVQGVSDADATAVIAYIRAEQQARGFKD
jgi:mono/diheme cytochrome c family protein